MQDNRTLTLQSIGFDCRNYIREIYRKKGLDEVSINIILSFLSENSIKQYNSALSKWNLFCAENGENILNIDVKLVIKFLTLQYQAGAKYSTLNSKRAALSLLCNNELSDNTELRDHPNLSTLIHGM